MRFAAAVLPIFFCAAALANVTPGPAPGMPSLDALLARARETSGAPYRYHIVSHSHATRFGRAFELTSETDGPKYRTRSCWKSICSGTYFDGERNYNANLNDTALPVATGVDALQLTLRAIFSYAFTAPDFRTGGGMLRERAPVVRGGRTFRRLSIAARGGLLLDALLDPGSGVVASVSTTDRSSTFEFGDARKIDGKVLLPFTVSLNGATIVQFERRSIENAPLEAPPGLVPTLVSNPAPLRLTKPGHASDQPVVPCTIGGQRVSCLFDTGNSGLAMSLELAEKLELEPRGGTFDISGVGKYMTGVVEAPALTVGPATYPAARYVILHDLRQYGYDVVLGADAFAHARVTIDYPHGDVIFAAENGPALEPGIGVTFENFIPVTPVRLGDLNVPLAIDTGDESTINLAYEYYQAHPELFKPSGAASVAGIGGTSAEVTGELPYVRIGGYEIEHPKIGATKDLRATANGHIGSGLLMHFAVTFDYANERIELVRPATRF